MGEGHEFWRDGHPTARWSLLHLLGDLVHPSRDPVPTSAFLSAMSDVGYANASIRQALSRAASRGMLASQRHGREARWALTDRAHGLIADGLQRVADLGRDGDEWDGRWVVLFVSIPHRRRAVRERVYQYLKWSGFGMPSTGMWISPHVDNEHGARFAIEHFELAGSCSSFIGTTASVGTPVDELVSRAWQLEDLDVHYRTVVDHHAGASPATGREALSALLALDTDLRRLPLLDPQLPKILAPGTSSRECARELLALRTAWLEMAHPHWQALVRQEG